MPNRDPLTTPQSPTGPVSESPRGPQGDGGIPDRTQEKPPLTPAQDPGDSKNPQDPTLNPALLPVGDPAGMA